MEFKYILILIVIVYLPVLITGKYTIRGVPESYAVLGENYRLECNVTDSPIHVIFCTGTIGLCDMINCGSSSTDNRYKCGCINNNNKQLYLNISNINKQDDTTWFCRGYNGGQGVTTISVYYPQDITSITSDAVNNEADEGSDVIFNCNVNSKPVSTITWSSSTSTDTNTGQDWTLTQAKCQDTGIYTCTANNGIGLPTTKSLPLNIRCSPRIEGNLKDVVISRTSEEVTLSIDVMAYPKPSFKWIQESTGLELTPDTTQQVATNNYISSLTVTIQQSSFDNYIVTVNNSIGGDKSYTIKIIDGDSSKPEPPSELNIPAIVGEIVAAVVVIIIIIVVVILIKRRKKKSPEESYATFTNRNQAGYRGLNTRPAVYENVLQNSEEYVNMTRN
ncbi:hypothetical protein LOTGIDRAFT_238930 [Lottia gigantea]|uniref:Ig-like domain-containing protein n=1 Tax=Lottia gigantea TaxID=225164 RepID=V4A590_LOTGI|nr:hypothetical protein LOTGIDRAFT_238930 [Lottia gigantea]ESO99088.1 hypothetical protein LOTGIDRAFT_238930 [Lottia gigantea]